KQVSAIADDDDMVQVHLLCNGGEPLHLLFGIDGIGFGDDLVVRHAVCEQIIAPYAALRLAGVFIGASAERDDDRRNLLLVEGNGFIKASVEYGGRPSHIFGGSEYGDGVRGAGVVAVCDCLDLAVDPAKPGDRYD